jgi:hypothetical protein
MTFDRNAYLDYEIRNARSIKSYTWIWFFAIGLVVLLAFLIPMNIISGTIAASGGFWMWLMWGGMNIWNVDIHDAQSLLDGKPVSPENSRVASRLQGAEVAYRDEVDRARREAGDFTFHTEDPHEHRLMRLHPELYAQFKEDAKPSDRELNETIAQHAPPPSDEVAREFTENEFQGRRDEWLAEADKQLDKFASEKDKDDKAFDLFHEYLAQHPNHIASLMKASADALEVVVISAPRLAAIFDGTVNRFCLTSHVALLSGEDEPENTQLKMLSSRSTGADTEQSCLWPAKCRASKAIPVSWVYKESKRSQSNR